MVDLEYELAYGRLNYSSCGGPGFGLKFVSEMKHKMLSKKIADCKFVWVVAPQQAVAMRDRGAGHQVRTDFPTYIPRSGTSTTHHYYYY